VQFAPVEATANGKLNARASLPIPVMADIFLTLRPTTTPGR
jgi:hypothetical protein